MKNNFNPSKDKKKGQFSANSKPKGEKFDNSGKPKKYNNFGNKQNTRRHGDGEVYSSDRKDRNNRDNIGYRGNGKYQEKDNNKKSRLNSAAKKFSRETYGTNNGRDEKGKTKVYGSKLRENHFYKQYKPYKKDSKNIAGGIEVKKVKPNEFDRTGGGTVSGADTIYESANNTESMTFGRNAVIELLKSDRTIDKLFVQSNRREGSITKIVAEAVRKSIPVVEIEKQKLDKMINGTSHQGVVAMTSEIEYCSIDDILNVAEERKEKPFILIADKIMDAQNLGAIIRTAECAGVHGIIIPKRHASGVSSVVGKISAGALFHIKISKVSNVALTIEHLKEKGVWAFASTSEIDDEKKTKGEEESKGKKVKEIKNYCDADYNLPLCLAVGNEGDGLSPIVLDKSDFLVNIPMYGKIESLNVSCATAVLLYEIARQRKL